MPEGSHPGNHDADKVKSDKNFFKNLKSIKFFIPMAMMISFAVFMGWTTMAPVNNILQVPDGSMPEMYIYQIIFSLVGLMGGIGCYRILSK